MSNGQSKVSVHFMGTLLMHSSPSHRIIIGYDQQYCTSVLFLDCASFTFCLVVSLTRRMFCLGCLCFKLFSRKYWDKQGHVLFILYIEIKWRFHLCDINFIPLKYKDLRHMLSNVACFIYIDAQGNAFIPVHE